MTRLSVLCVYFICMIFKSGKIQGKDELSSSYVSKVAVCFSSSCFLLSVLLVAETKETKGFFGLFSVFFVRLLFDAAGSQRARHPGWFNSAVNTLRFIKPNKTARCSQSTDTGCRSN